MAYSSIRSIKRNMGQVSKRGPKMSVNRLFPFRHTLPFGEWIRKKLKKLKKKRLKRQANKKRVNEQLFHSVQDKHRAKKLKKRREQK